MNAERTTSAFWCLSFAYTDWNQAGTAYEACRDLIFGNDIDAAAYRILLNGRAFVVLVGSGIPDEPDVDQLTEICCHGESIELPDEVVLTLAIRHEQFRTPYGTKFERRAHL